MFIKDVIYFEQSFSDLKIIDNWKLATLKAQIFATLFSWNLFSQFTI